MKSPGSPCRGAAGGSPGIPGKRSQTQGRLAGVRVTAPLISGASPIIALLLPKRYADGVGASQRGLLASHLVRLAPAKLQAMGASTKKQVWHPGKLIWARGGAVAATFADRIGFVSWLCRQF